MEGIAAQHAADWLLAEHEARRRFQTLTAPNAPATISDAYDIQDRYVALLADKNGERAGYKIGLTSPTMQAFCRIDHPIGGVVFARRVHQSGIKISRSDFGRLGLEFEVAVRIKSAISLAGTSHTLETVAPHVEGVCAAIEIVDDRAADYAKLDVLSLVADNSWNAGIVLTEFKSSWGDLVGVTGRATRGGEIVGEGRGGDILGHPFNSVAWLANHLAARGGRVEAGDIVMTGSCIKTIFPEHEGHYRFDLEDLGSVAVQVL